MTDDFNDYEQAKMIDRVRNILQGQIDDQNLGKLIRGGKYDQTAKDIMDERLAMDKYWKKVKEGLIYRPKHYKKGGYGTKRGAKDNPWIQFIEKYKGEGYSLKELSRMYNSQKGGVYAAGLNKKYKQTKKDRMDEAKAMKAYWKKVHGGKYEQNLKDRLDESEAMDRYWARIGTMHPKYKQTLKDRMDESLGMDRYWNERRGYLKGGRDWDEIKKLNLKQLKQVSKGLGLRGYSGLRKKDLLSILKPDFIDTTGPDFEFEKCHQATATPIAREYKRRARKTYSRNEINALRANELHQLAERIGLSGSKIFKANGRWKNKKEIGKAIKKELRQRQMGRLR